MIAAAVVDTSAVMAVLLDEEDGGIYHDALLRLPTVMSLATFVEFGLAARRRVGPLIGDRASRLVAAYGISLAPLDDKQAAIALAAIERFAKGHGAEPAILNYGDLFSYALAKARDLPLLYKGGDFARTDVRSALAELGA